MATKRRVEYAQAQGAPAGFTLPGLIVATAALARDTLTVSASAATNYALNAASGIARITAITNGVFGRLAQNADKDSTKATGVLTLTGVITPGKHATSVITSDTTNVTDGDTVTIGSTVYRLKDTMLAAYDVKIGASAAATLDNLKAAINASGTAGVEYFTGTAAHPTVVATTNTDTAQTVVARVPGTAANTAATTEASTHLSWADTTLGGGTGASDPGVASETVTIGSKVYSFVDVLSETNGAAAIVNQVLFGADSAAALDNLKLAINGGATAGTEYSTGTVAHTQVTATTNTNTAQTIEALSSGASYNSVATTETLANGAWATATMTGGDTASWDFYIVAGTTVDIPIEETMENLSFIADAGAATVYIAEY